MYQQICDSVPKINFNGQDLQFDQLYIQYNYQMSSLQVQRPHSQSIRRKRPQSALNEQVEMDAKAYRYLFSLLIDNLNLMGKTHRECFGDLQPQSKIKIICQEQQVMSEQLIKIYNQFEDKLGRQLFNRNNYIRKSYSQFYDCYRLTQNGAEQQSYQTQVVEEQSLTSEKNFVILPPAKKIASFFSLTPPKRPMSSRFTADINTLNQAMNNFNKSGAPQIYKIKTITTHLKQNPQIKESKSKCLMVTLQKAPIRDKMFRGKKSVTLKSKEMSGQKRYNMRNYEQFNFNGNEIMISENRPRDMQSIQRDNNMDPKMPQNAKLCTKRILNRKYSQQKSIDQIEKMQIQSRIMMVNSVLSVNLPQSQGYKAKSKCYQNYFNQ